MFASATEAANVSDWVAAGHARVRLIDAGGFNGRRLAGLQIQLDPAYLTYWRTPGDAGVPPAADFGRSRNVASATLAFPAPQRFDEGGADAFGYKDEVVFPVTVTPVDPARPTLLSVALSFAVCADLCLQESAAVDLALAGTGTGPEADVVRDAQSRVPEPQPLAVRGRMAIESVTTAGATVQVLARVPDGGTPSLFVEAPDPWYIKAGEGRPADGGRFTFDLQVLSGSKTAARIPVVLTLVQDKDAIETGTELDVRAPAP